MLTETKEVTLDDARNTIIKLLPSLDLIELGEVYGWVKARALYRDPSHAERACDSCGKPYQGPALYCSLRCAMMGAPKA